MNWRDFVDQARGLSKRGEHLKAVEKAELAVKAAREERAPELWIALGRLAIFCHSPIENLVEKGIAAAKEAVDLALRKQGPKDPLVVVLLLLLLSFHAEHKADYASAEPYCEWLDLLFQETPGSTTEVAPETLRLMSRVYRGRGRADDAARIDGQLKKLPGDATMGSGG
jgi:hypothetical protein